jgi:precorrin-6B methylase 2
VITLTTDLGETFYPEPVDLVASLRSLDHDGDIYLRKKVPWKAGDRAAACAFKLDGQDVEWPACLHVAVKPPPPPSDGAGRPARGREAAGFLPPFVDVWSGGLNPMKGAMESGFRVERRFVSLAERTVSLLEDAGDSIARHLWDGSLALVQHVDQTISLQAPAALPLLEYVLVSATYRHLNVLELGCGCGTVGIALAQAVPDCDVLLTDLEEARETAEANVARMNAAMSSKVAFAALDWTEPLPAKVDSRINDLIFVSECTYNTETLQPLVDTLSSLITRSPKAVIVLATKTRHASEAAFFGMMKEAGLIEDGKIRVPLTGEPGTGYADWATDVGVHIFRGKEHRLSPSPRESAQLWRIRE